jgi:hypothetical protein
MTTAPEPPERVAFSWEFPYGDDSVSYFQAEPWDPSELNYLAFAVPGWPTAPRGESFGLCISNLRAVLAP